LGRLKLKREDARCEYIIDYNGNPLTTLKRSFKMVLKKAGIEKKVRLYDLRPMYGTHMAKEGGVFLLFRSSWDTPPLLPGKGICTMRRNSKGERSIVCQDWRLMMGREHQI
jgi:hypothetical protein